MPETNKNIDAFKEGTILGVTDAYTGIKDLPALLISAAKGVPGLTARIAEDPVGFSRRVMDTWEQMSPAQRQDVLDMLGQAGGGLAGGIIGGLAGSGIASVPAAAAAGSAGTVGGDFLAKVFGPLVGAEGFDPNQSTADAIRETTRLAVGGGIGDLLGGTLGLAAKNTGRAAEIAAKYHFKPTEAQKALNNKADELGLGDKLSMFSRLGREHQGLAMLAASPSGVRTNRKAAAGDLNLIDDKYGELGRIFHENPVDAPAFYNRARIEIEGGRRNLDDAAERIMALVPNVEPERAGSLYRSSRGAALDANRELGDLTFGKLLAEHGDTRVPVGSLGEDMRSIIDSNASRQAVENAINDDSRRVIESLGSIRPKVAPGAPPKRNALGLLVNRSGESLQQPTVTLRDLHNLRSELTKKFQTIQGEDQGFTRSRLNQVLEAIARVEDEAAASGAIPGNVYDDLKRYRRDWFNEKSRLDLPRGDDPRSPGNEMANLWKLPRNQIVSGAVQPKSPLMLREAIDAATPANPLTLKPEPTPALQDFLSGAFREKIAPRTGHSPNARYSPLQIRSNADEYGPEVLDLLGHRNIVDAVASPKMVSTDELMNQSKLAKLVDSSDVKPEQGLRGATGTVDNLKQTQSILGEGWTNRAVYDDLLDRSRTPDPRLGGGGMERLLNPQKLDKNVRDSQTVIDAMFDGKPDQKKTLNDLLRLGLGTKATEFAYGNPSGTAILTALFNTVKSLVTNNPLTPQYWLNATGMIGAPYIASKVVHNPKAAKILTSDPRGFTTNLGPIGQAASRSVHVPMAMKREVDAETERLPVIPRAALIENVDDLPVIPRPR